MCTSTDDCFCHEQVRQSPSPNCSCAQRSTSSADMASTRRVVRRRAAGLGVAKQHLLQRVAAQPEPERLQRDDLLGRDVAEVDRRAELLDEPDLRGLRRRLEDDVLEPDRVRDLADQLGAHAAGRVEDAGGAALARLGDRPSRRRRRAPRWSHCVHSSAVYSTDESFEPTSERTVKSRAKSAISSSFRSRGMSTVPSEISTCVRPRLAEPALVLVELARRVDDLEEGAADDDRLLAEHLELALRGSASRRPCPSRA